MAAFEKKCLSLEERGYEVAGENNHNAVLNSGM